MDFTTYMKRVDASLEDICGLGSSDLADAPFRDYFTDGITPREAAILCLQDWNDFPEIALD